MEKAVKLLLAILLLICVLKMPYGYYEFIRFVAFVGFGYLAYQSFVGLQQIHAFIFAVLALLFQPFLKVYLGRDLWIVVDIVVAFFLLYQALFKSSTKQ